MCHPLIHFVQLADQPIKFGDTNLLWWPWPVACLDERSSRFEQAAASLHILDGIGFSVQTPDSRVAGSVQDCHNCSLQIHVNGRSHRPYGHSKGFVDSTRPRNHLHYTGATQVKQKKLNCKEMRRKLKMNLEFEMLHYNTHRTYKYTTTRPSRSISRLEENMRILQSFPFVLQLHNCCSAAAMDRPT
jgi:hypothetical protein